MSQYFNFSSLIYSKTIADFKWLMIKCYALLSYKTLDSIKNTYTYMQNSPYRTLKILLHCLVFYYLVIMLIFLFYFSSGYPMSSLRKQFL